MDARYTHRIPIKKIKRLYQLLEQPLQDIELSSYPFSSMPLTSRLVNCDEDGYVLGHVWDKIPDSMLFRIHLYPSDKNVIMECRCLHDKEKIFDRWYKWVIQNI
jgi:hypothetical protein